MNTNEYIESGILELYVMGSLSACEMEEVATNIRKYPILALEVEAIEESLVAFSDMNLNIEMDDSILNNALNTIKKEKEAKVIALPQQEIAPQTTPIDKEPKQEKNNIFKLGMAAAIAGLIVSIGFNYMNSSNVSTLENQIAALQDNQSVLEESINNLSNTNTDFENQLAIVTDPSNEVVVMKGLEIAPDALATVYWHQESKETRINIANLATPPEGMQYQLWALYDGQPIDAGVFDVADQIQVTKSIENADAFAVTLETAGGNPTPNLEMLYIIGNV